MDIVVEAIVLALAGFVIGGFSGLLGIGGGTVMVPVLRLGFAFEAVVATATSLFTIIFTSIGATVTHLRNKTCIPRLGVCLGVGGAITSALGAWLGDISPSWAVMLVAALVITYSACNMLTKALKLPKKNAAEGEGEGTCARGIANPGAPGERVAPSPIPAAASSVVVPEDAYEFTLQRALGGLCIGLIAGLASGYVGVGGGFIMVPLMTTFLSVPMYKASGTSLVAIMILAIPGVATQIYFGNVNFLAGALLAVGTIPGAMVGARFVKRIPERQMRFIFAAFLGIAAIVLVINELASL